MRKVKHVAGRQGVHHFKGRFLLKNVKRYTPLREACEMTDHANISPIVSFLTLPCSRQRSQSTLWPVSCELQGF
jgi:hypothetical protein